MTTNNCNICNRVFATKYSLIRHQNNLTCQNNKQCCFCKKNFLRKLEYNKHLSNCKLLFSDTEILNLKNKIESLIQHINYLETQNKDLQDRLEKIALTSVKRPTITNNTINNLVPLTKNWLEEQSSQLSIQDIENGIQGYAKFACEKSFKDRVVCLDSSRKKLQYIEEDKTIINDINGNRLAKVFFESIQNKNKVLTEELKNFLINKIIQTQCKSETEILGNKLNTLIDNCLGINNVANGNPDEIKDRFIKEICALLPKKS